MSLPADHPLSALQFYLSADYPCGYLPDHRARSLVAMPQPPIDAHRYDHLVRAGFRRSGSTVYRPHCDGCNACIPVRIPVEEFTPNRSQRRAAKQHANLIPTLLQPHEAAHCYPLYRDYQAARHPGDGMAQDRFEQYRDFLMQSQVETIFITFHEGDTLRMVSVADVLADGLSAVYAFYDCTQSGTAFGTFNVLWLANRCQQLALPYLYLGYWIAESPKMAYKRNFAPLEGFIGNRWQQL